MRNTLIGIGIGILLLLGLYLFHTNSIEKAYQSGLQDCSGDTLYVAGDTIRVVDTIYVKPQHIKPTVKPYEPPDKPKYAIDTTIYFQNAGRVRVYSDDIAEGLYIEPIYYLELNVRVDTMFIDKVKYVPVPCELEFHEKPTFLMVTGAVIGGTIVYFLRK